MGLLVIDIDREGGEGLPKEILRCIHEKNTEFIILERRVSVVVVVIVFNCF